MRAFIPYLNIPFWFRMIVMFRLLIVLVFSFLSAQLTWANDYPSALTGKPSRIVDGDTIHLDGHKIRLLGIDTPEMKQYCQDKDGVPWPCGIRARDMLAGMLYAGEETQCQITGRDRYKRLLGRCFSNGLDVQKALIASGFGVAEYTDDYRKEERLAKSQRLGMWAGTFERPRDYRRKN